MIRILAVIDRFPPFHTGGDETSCWALLDGLKRRGHDVVVLTSRYGVDGPVRDGNVHRVLTYVQHTSSLLSQAVLELRDHREVRRIVRASRPDVIAVWSIFALFPSIHRELARSRVPVVYNMQNLWLDRHLQVAQQHEAVWRRAGSSLLNRAAKPIVRGFVRFMDNTCSTPVSLSDVDLRHVVQCSQSSHAAHRAVGLDGEAWTTVFNAIDLERFKQTPSRSVDGPLSVLFAGRLVESKGPHTAIDAVAALARRNCHVRLTIAGPDGYPQAYIDRLRTTIEQEKIADRVCIIGMVPYAEVPALLARHQVLVFPSIAPEGFPMTLIEAMASGLAVVSTETGGSKEILVNSVNSLTFAPGDATQLASHLERLASDAGLRAALGSAGRAWVSKNCSVDVIAAQWETYVQSVVLNANINRSRNDAVDPALNPIGRIA